MRIRHICFDSRMARTGTLFVALTGTTLDGHDYISEAIAAGGVAIVCATIPQVTLAHVTYVVVADSARALGILAANFFGQPSMHLKLVGITGTNGKTSTVHALFGVFSRLGYRVGMLSTIHNQICDQILPATHTTPDALQLNELLARMVAQRCQFCFMEVSSHAIAQERITGLKFAGAVFLNITHDHLDYHHTFSAYINTKKKLFDGLSATSFALYNLDDKHGTVMIQNTKARTCSFALKTPATYMAQVLTNTWQGLSLRIAQQMVWVRWVGTFNAYNLLATYATACLLGEDSLKVLTAISALPPMRGRFQYISSTQVGYKAIIDYAHTPDALKNVLTTIAKIEGDIGKIITVIGCGGNRDSQKRPLMGKIAFRYSRLVIFTSDNPRNESPQAIIQDMKMDMTAVQQQQSLCIVDRAEAIRTACQLAQPNDIILIAGKGHETYQEIRGQRYPFDDWEILKNNIR